MQRAAHFLNAFTRARRMHAVRQKRDIQILRGVDLRYLTCGIVAPMRPLLERIAEQIDKELNA